jgi:hypothetical protein
VARHVISLMTALAADCHPMADRNGFST